MRRAYLAATVIVTAVMTTALYSTRAYSQDDLFLFNTAMDSSYAYTSTLIINSAIGASADIAADDNYQMQSSDPEPLSYPSGSSDSASDTAWIAPASRNVPYEAISYTVDPAIRAESIAKYIELARQVNRADGDYLEQLFRDRDLIGEFTQNARAYGLDVSDFGDVMTAYWAVSWGAVNQTGRPSYEQVQGLRTQLREVLAGSQLAERTSPADLQRMADDMMVKLIVVDGGVEESLRTGNVAELQRLSQGVQQDSLSSMGIDLASFDLTNEGLTLR
jgi:hypothetical protein